MKRNVMMAVVAAVFVGGAFCGWILPRRAGVEAGLPAASDAAGYKHTLTLATYNVRNLFDGYDNPYTADEKAQPKSPAEMAELARAIRALDADVLILQEVEAGGVLKSFVDNHLADMRYAYVVDAVTEDPRGITVAALSRLPVIRIVSHRLAPLEGGRRFARDLLRLDIEAGPGHLLSVYGMHLKSKRTSEDSEDKNAARWRLAEATRARELIREEMAAGQALGGARFVVMGDANDSVDSAAVQMLMATTEPPLIDALAGIPAGERVTYKGVGYREAIDQVLVSPGLREAVLPGSAVILEGVGFAKASDHRPVRITVRTP